jgi:hypothetical protein
VEELEEVFDYKGLGKGCFFSYEYYNGKTFPPKYTKKFIMLKFNYKRLRKYYI